jgi:N6-adenosine-specific RNA methylase IME4
MSAILPANDNHKPEGPKPTRPGRGARQPKYDIVLADPPWDYYGNPNSYGAAAQHYDLMSDEELLALNVRDRWMTDRSILFLWTTAPRMGFAYKCLEAWGLHDRGVQFVWAKTTKHGVPVGAQGVRPSIVKPTCEFVIAGSTVRRGRPLKLSDEGIRHTILAPKTQHSRKPDDVHERIARMYPTARKIELFARRPYPGWDAWGNQAPANSNAAIDRSAA